MSKKARSAFQDALKAALDKYYSNWRSRYSKYKDAQLETDTDTLIAWVDKGKRPQAAAFQRFLDTGSLPPEARENLRNLYQQLPLPTRKTPNSPFLAVITEFTGKKLIAYSAAIIFALQIAVIVLVLATKIQPSTNGWCLSTAVGMNTIGNQREVYFHAQANIRNFIEHPFYVYFDGEYVDGNYLRLEGCQDR